MCPVEVPNEHEQGLTKRKAIFRPYAQAFPNIFTIDKKERPPCSLTCPAGVNVQGYIALIAEGKHKEALALIRERIPLPGVLGRVCTHPCEAKCRRDFLDEPLSIAALKRFAFDQVEEDLHQSKIEAKEEKVAIIGSGPAGLTCAYFLAQQGYQVTIFESLPVVGGMLCVGIPEYRLPKNILEKEVEAIKRLGVEIRTNTTIGKDLTIEDLFSQGYKAVFIGVGSHKSRRLEIPGEDSEGVVHGVTFLRDLNLGKKVGVGKKVAVIGGGNVAIDAARSALRLGSEEVFILYRRSRQEMPASDEEIEAAETEGIGIQYLVAPIKILVSNGKVAGIGCIRMELGEPDVSGRRRPIPIEGSEFQIDVDMVIPAIGQASDLSFLTKDIGVEITRGGNLVVNPITYATTCKGIFAGGDAVTGPAIAIEAIAAGREAAISIDRYLKGENLEEGRAKEPVRPLDLTDIPLGKEKRPRIKMPTFSLDERIKSFKEVEKGFTEEMAIQEANRCLNCGICSECLQCVDACKAEAIDHRMREKSIGVQVGSIILALGFDEFDPKLIHEYGYSRFPNVITSIEFERILSASGPYLGKIQRLSDGKVPKSIAFIQCVGSRDLINGNSYCSSVCCMYAVKESVVAKEHDPSLEISIFGMDMRAQGKGFDTYLERAQQEQGINFVRAKVFSIEEIPETKDLILRYVADDGKMREEIFSLVVLSVGLEPSKGSKELARRLGLGIDDYGFCRTKEFSPLETTRPGIFVTGAFQGPKDIPDTVAQASGAMVKSAGLLSEARGTLVKEKEYPPEIDVKGKEPRIGVFVCHCGINIGGVVNVPEVRDYVRTLDNVVYAEDNLYTCSQDTQEKIKEMIKEHNLNRVVVASCSPRTHEPLFQETIREAGLNRYLFEMANIRDQCSWVHQREPEKATQKAKDLLKMKVAKARLIHSLEEIEIPVKDKGLVIGGGIAGMNAALEIANQGFECYLVEKDKEVGGNLRNLYYSIEGGNVQKFLEDTIKKVEENDLIHIYTDTEIKDISGYIGNFTTTIMNGKGSEQLEHGVIVVATGGEEYKPTEYLYGEDEKVITQLELEERLAKNSLLVKEWKNVVMIQCVGSRNGEHPYCSKVCCSQAIKNALKLKEVDPSTNIYILYRDMRTYGFLEEYYSQARAKGIVFLRYDNEMRPEVTREDGKIKVRIFDPIMGEDLLLDPDILVLSVAIVPTPNEDLAKLLKVPLTDEGFFLEAHAKLRPVEFSTDGIFLCGMAHFPKPISESISQSSGAAGKAGIPLSKGLVRVEPTISWVDEEKCIGCSLCEAICPFKAIQLKDTGAGKRAETLLASCKGCGLCGASCPQRAITNYHFTEDQLFAEINALAM